MHMDEALMSRPGGMTYASAIVFALIGLVTSAAVKAGGSDVRVTVVSFVASNSDYTLVVAPVAASQPDPYLDPYMGHCRRFTVLGTYSRLAGLSLSPPPMVTLSAHRDALRYLRTAATSHATIRLGWMGGGFRVPDTREPCVARSRALALFSDEHGTAVISFCDAI